MCSVQLVGSVTRYDAVPVTVTSQSSSKFNIVSMGSKPILPVTMNTMLTLTATVTGTTSECVNTPVVLTQ